MKRNVSIAVAGVMVLIFGTVLVKAWISEPQAAQATVADQASGPVIEAQQAPPPVPSTPQIEMVVAEAAEPQAEPPLQPLPEEPPDTTWTVLVVQGSDIKTVTFDSPDYTADIP